MGIPVVDGAASPANGSPTSEPEVGSGVVFPLEQPLHAPDPLMRIFVALTFALPLTVIALELVESSAMVPLTVTAALPEFVKALAPDESASRRRLAIVDTVTVITNSYDAAFGGLGGAQVNEISRSGGNQWHGNASYWWNGRAMNANSYFNKQSGSPRNFDNANQWAAAIGGPIKKDKIFGFIDQEGIRVIIPVRGTSYGPSPAYQAAISPSASNRNSA